jgi:hypothetical protein
MQNLVRQCRPCRSGTEEDILPYRKRLRIEARGQMIGSRAAMESNIAKVVTVGSRNRRSNGLGQRCSGGSERIDFRDQ